MGIVLYAACFLGFGFGSPKGKGKNIALYHCCTQLPTTYVYNKTNKRQTHYFSEDTVTTITEKELGLVLITANRGES